MTTSSRFSLAILFALTAVGGCGSEAELLIDVRTDYLSEEVGRIELDLNGAPSGRTPISASDDLMRGVRVGSLGGLEDGEYRVEVRLIDRSGAELARRRLGITVQGITGTTVIITRNCRNVTCPNGAAREETECLNGACVVSQCTPETPNFCAGTLCRTGSDCPAATASCATSACQNGACFDLLAPGACALEQVCAVGGCIGETMSDAGVGDAGIDVACAAPLSACGSDCANLDDDAAHCGSCDGVCSATQGCFEGSCIPTDACLESVGVPCVQVVQSHFKASNTGAGDTFGTSVSLDGDRLAVGAPAERSASRGINEGEDDDRAYGSGAVYVFVRSAGAWIQEAYIKSPNSDTSDGFGTSVSLDGTTLAVGAPGEASSARGIGEPSSDDRASRSGAVYTFTREAEAWSFDAYFKASNTGANDQFGLSLSLDGDTLLVGAPFEASAARRVDASGFDDTAPNAGSAYVFVRAGGAWTQQAYLKANNTDPSDRFGTALAVSGDTIVVGAPGEGGGARGVGGDPESNEARASGAAYVFTRTAGIWSQRAYLKASNADSNDLFGTSISFNGDLLAVGAPHEANSAVGVGPEQFRNDAVRSGAVYLFTQSDGAWSQDTYIKASNTGATDLFGQTVALFGDVLAVGAPGEQSTSTGINGDQSIDELRDAGAVYVFSRGPDGWAQALYLKAPYTGVSDQFGAVLVLDNGTLVSGAPREDSSMFGVDADLSDEGSRDSGAVYSFRVAR